MDTPTQEYVDPGQAAVHTDAPMNGDKPKKKVPNTHFMQRMMLQMMEKVSGEDWAAMRKHAAAHAGGMTKAEKAKMAAMEELYKEMPADDPDNDPTAEPDADPDDAPKNTKGTKNTKPAEKQMAEGDEEAAESLTATLREIESAFRTWAKKPNRKPDEWPDCNYWCREVFDGYVIAEGCADAELYKIPYTESAKGDGYNFGLSQKVVTKYVVASEVADLCADGHGWRLFVEQDFGEYAEPPQWMPLLPKPGKYQHPKYKEIKLTKTRNASFADGVNNKIYQSSLPINTEHAPSNEGAFGWIEEARLNEDGSVDARVTWTDLGKEAIENDRFRYISPEWVDECDTPDGKKLKDVIRGAALTVRPFFKDKHLRPLVASERGWEVLGHALPATDEPQLFFFTALAPSAPASTPEIPTQEEPKAMAEKNAKETPVKDTTPEPEKPVEKAAPVVQAAEPAVDAKAFAEMQAKFAAIEAENAAIKQAAEAQAAEVKKLSEDNAALKDEAETLRFTEEVTGKVKDNRHAYIGETAKHVKQLKSLAKAFGEDSEEFKFYVETQRQAAAVSANSLLFREMGRGGADAETSAYGKVVAMARAAQEKDKTLSEQQAIAVVLKDPTNAKLYSEYLAEDGN